MEPPSEQIFKNQPWIVLWQTLFPATLSLTQGRRAVSLPLPLLPEMLLEQGVKQNSGGERTKRDRNTDLLFCCQSSHRNCHFMGFDGSWDLREGWNQFHHLLLKTSGAQWGTFWLVLPGRLPSCFLLLKQKTSVTLSLNYQPSLGVFISKCSFKCAYIRLFKKN